MSIQDLSTDLSPQPAASAPLRLQGIALFLDLDGTLAPIAARPQDVGPNPRRTALLERLSDRLDGRLAVVSGRTLADVDRILDGKVAAVAAVHGLALRTPDGTVTQTPAHPAVGLAVAALRDFASQDPGLIVEDKGLSVTLHYRLAPGLADAARAYASDLARQSGLTLLDGDAVAELRTPGPTKGDSVQAFMGQAPFAGAQPIFLGDDVTDEDGFRAVQGLGGMGVAVGARRPTAAHAALADVDAVLDWLEASL